MTIKKTMSKSAIKIRIRTSRTVDDADTIISNNYDFKTYREKSAFLLGMFDIKLFDRHDGENVTQEEIDKMDYYALLSAIIQ